jgi:hypothetical protein
MWRPDEGASGRKERLSIGEKKNGDPWQLAPQKRPEDQVIQLRDQSQSWPCWRRGAQGDIGRQGNPDPKAKMQRNISSSDHGMAVVIRRIRGLRKRRAGFVYLP